MATFPTTPEEVTVDWLADHLPHAPAGFEWSYVGTGQVGDSVRFTLDYHGGADGPPSVVAKFPAADETSRATATGFGLYRHEVGFYRHVAGQVGMRVPRCHAAKIDEDGGDFILLMEDCGPCEQGDQLAGCTAEQAREVVRQAALLHRGTWGREDLFAAQWLAPKPEARAMLGAAYPQATAVFAERYADALEPELMEVVRALGEHSDRWFDRDVAPRCLVHGDYRLDNMLFAIHGGLEPLAVLDWQTLVPGDGLTDIGYFLGAGIKPDLRAEIETELLSLYREEMARGGIELSDEDMRDGYAGGALHGVATAVFSAAFVKRTERGDAMFLAMADGACRLVRDIDALRLVRGG